MMRRTKFRSAAWLAILVTAAPLSAATVIALAGGEVRAGEVNFLPANPSKEDWLKALDSTRPTAPRVTIPPSRHSRSGRVINDMRNLQIGNPERVAMPAAPGHRVEREAEPAPSVAPAPPEPTPQPAEPGASAGSPSTGSGSAGPAVAVRITFGFDGSEIRSEWYGTLDTLAQAMLERAAEAPILRIEGHTDASGTAEYNYRLSVRRAAAVKRYLVNRGVSGATLVAVGKGESELLPNLAPNAADNRRVQFALQ